MTEAVLSNNVTSPYRLWILISAIGFTVMALMVSVANTRKSLLFVRHNV